MVDNFLNGDIKKIKEVNFLNGNLKKASNKSSDKKFLNGDIKKIPQVDFINVKQLDAHSGMRRKK